MNHKDICFVTYCFGDQRYFEQLDRLKKSILDLIPDANLLFYVDELPPGARPFGQSLYGGKPHAIAEAKKNFSKVLWLDPAMILVDSNLNDFDDVYFAAVKDDHFLNPFISNQALDFFGVSRNEIEDVHLVGGSLYYFDFEFKVVQDIFDMWIKSEIHNMFDGEGQVHTGASRGHRSDEALMALAMWKYGVQPTGAGDIRYCIEKNPMTIKRHFK